ncbi:hypothetical protein [Tenacibaculum amylolyticum]|uniref:hypothetical protein n=1 Tax=Tenacibaculum amylolyticum TaxID=104269 RepID=UPI0038931E30
MSFFSRIWNKIRGSKAILYPTFKVAEKRVVNGTKSVPIMPRKSYFEISLTEQFLRDKREYWKEYIPLTVFLTDFIYDDKRSSFPFVVGPDLLKNIEQLEGNESIRYKNTRIVGPTPYRGDNIAIFSGLFRIRTVDWAAQTIGLLENVAKAFDATKLTSYINIADPLLNSIENFFGMGKDTQLRIGQRREFKDPEIHSTADTFSSGYWIMLRKDQKDVDKTKFWVKDNELYYGTNKGNIKPYRENDFILFEINASDKRNDYETFDFHDHWESAREALINGELSQAEKQFRMFTVGLYSCKDIIEDQKQQLLVFYAGMFEKLRTRFTDKSSVKDILAKLKETKDTIEAKGVKIEVSDKAIEISANIAEKMEKQFQENNFYIDQHLIEEALNSPLLNTPEILNEDNFNISNTSIDLI